MNEQAVPVDETKIDDTSPFADGGAITFTFSFYTPWSTTLACRPLHCERGRPVYAVVAATRRLPHSRPRPRHTAAPSLHASWVCVSWEATTATLRILGRDHIVMQPSFAIELYGDERLEEVGTAGKPCQP